MFRRAALLLNLVLFVALLLGARSGWSPRDVMGSLDSASTAMSDWSRNDSNRRPDEGSQLAFEARKKGRFSDDLYGAYGGSRFALVDVERHGVAGNFALEGPRGVTISPDGNNVYVAAADSHALVVFDRDEATGSLNPVEVHQDGIAGVFGLSGAWKVIVSPDGANVYVLGRSSSAIAYFSRDPSTGTLTFIDSAYGLSYPSGLVCSADGASLYVTSAGGDGSVVVFDRSPVTGDLTWVETIDGATLPVGSLDSANGIAMDANDENVYVCASNGQSIVAFARDSFTGALTFVNAEIVGSGNVSDPSGPTGIVVSPDGESALVVGVWSQAIAVFDRDQGTGALTFANAIHDALNNGMSRIAVDSEGRQAFAVSFYGDLVASLNRAPGTAWQGPVVLLTDDLAGGNRLHGASSVAISPDNRHIYVVAALDDAVTAFSVLLFRDGVELGTTEAWSY